MLIISVINEDDDLSSPVLFTVPMCEFALNGRDEGFDIWLGRGGSEVGRDFISFFFSFLGKCSK